MNKAKRLLAFLLVFALTFGAVPIVSLYAYDAEAEYAVRDEANGYINAARLAYLATQTGSRDGRNTMNTNLEKAIELLPYRVDLLHNLAGSLSTSATTSNAVKIVGLYDQILEINPNDAAALFYKAYWMHYQDNFDDVNTALQGANAPTISRPAIANIGKARVDSARIKEVVDRLAAVNPSRAALLRDFFYFVEDTLDTFDIEVYNERREQRLPPTADADPSFQTAPEAPINSGLVYDLTAEMITNAKNAENPTVPGTEAGKVAIVTLGNALNDDGSMSQIMLGRLNKTIDVYKKLVAEGVEPLVYVTGGVPKAGTNEGIEMKKYLIKAGGIPEEAIIPEHHSTNTPYNGIYTQQLLAASGVKHVVLISSHSHVRRGSIGLYAVCLANGTPVTIDRVSWYDEPSDIAESANTIYGNVFQTFAASFGESVVKFYPQ